MRADPLSISVCMATYNGAAYVVAQLESIIEQLNPGDEIVIVDDCSTDTTLDKIDRVVANSPALANCSVLVERNTNNRGHVLTFERALAAAANDIVVLADQDDVWIPGYLTKLRDLFEANLGVGLIVAQPKFCDENLTPIAAANDRYRHPRRGGVPGVVGFLLNRSMPRGCTMSLRRTELAYVLPFPKQLLAHDHWIFATATLRRRMFALDQDVIMYRRHSAVLSKRRPVQKMISSRVLLIWQLLRHGLTRGQRSEAELGLPK